MTYKPNWTRLERERQRKDAELYESQRVEPVEYIELNMSNYDEYDVARLNEWAQWAVGRIEELELQRVRSPDKELQLWNWIHEDMGCYVQESASITGDQWAVLDSDGEVVAAGTTTVDALRAAENKILQSPGHEPI